MNTNENTLNPVFVQDIRDMLQQARQKTYAAVNFIMVETYWRIGRRIVEDEQAGAERAAYGEQLLKELSRALSAEFGRGFSSPNLRNFRQFYLTYPDEAICYTLCNKLTWSHNRLIMRIENTEARTYYLKEALAQSWSVRQLERNIASHYYERLLATQGQLPPAEPERLRPADFVKDPLHT
jgi:hypothetical protein